MTGTTTAYLMGHSTFSFSFITLLRNEYSLHFRGITSWEIKTLHTLWKGQSCPKKTNEPKKFLTQRSNLSVFISFKNKMAKPYFSGLLFIRFQ